MTRPTTTALFAEGFRPTLISASPAGKSRVKCRIIRRAAGKDRHRIRTGSIAIIDIRQVVVRRRIRNSSVGRRHGAWLPITRVASADKNFYNRRLGGWNALWIGTVEIRLKIKWQPFPAGGIGIISGHLADRKSALGARSGGIARTGSRRTPILKI